MFQIGKKYHRQTDLHGHFGGQRQGGISTPSGFNAIFLFTGESGEAFGYKDEFRPDGIYWYTGEGQHGDMVMLRGNRAIRDHQLNGKNLHLFEAIGNGYVRYMGQAFYLNHHYQDRPDFNNQIRKAIIFELQVEIKVNSNEPLVVAENKGQYDKPRRLWSRPLDEVRDLALHRSKKDASAKQQKSNVYTRSEAIRVYVLRRAGRFCEGCETEAPFLNRRRRPYLEPHHVHRVSDGGPDHPRWVIALCPNCHARVHYGQDGDTYNEELKEKLSHIEPE